MLTDVRMGIPENVYAKWGEYTKLLCEMDGHALLKVVDAALSSQWYGTRANELEDTLKICKSCRRRRVLNGHHRLALVG